MSEEPSAARLRVAVVGLGNWGSRLLAALLALPEYEVVALCDADSDKLERTPGPKERFASLSRLLASVDVEAVFVAVTPQAQGPLGLEVLAAGRHLFVEKPMALEGHVAAELARAAADKGRVVCVGHVIRYHPLVREALSLVQRGALGRVHHVYCERIGARPRPGISSWWVLAPHDLSFLLAAFPGESRWLGVREESGRGVRARLALSGDVVADLRVAGDGEPQRLTLLLGDAGSLLIDEGSSTLRRYARALEPAPGATLQDLLAELSKLSADVRTLPGQPLQLELSAFFRAIRYGEPLPTDAADGYRVVAALEAGELALSEAAQAYA